MSIMQDKVARAIYKELSPHGVPFESLLDKDDYLSLADVAIEAMKETLRLTYGPNGTGRN